MRVADGVLIETEELSKFTQGEMALHVLLLVHHAAAQGFLVRLSLQNLLFDCPGLPAQRRARQTPECSAERHGYKVSACGWRVWAETDSEQPVDVAGLPLAVSPHAGHGLLVVRRVPVRVEHHQAIGTNQVQTTAASLAAQHEDELWTLAKTHGSASVSSASKTTPSFLAVAHSRMDC